MPGRIALAALFLYGLVSGGTSPCNAQFKVIGPAPVSRDKARQRIKSLLADVKTSNQTETISAISGLLNWYRDLFDEELIAAWKTGPRLNLAGVVEALADERIAAGIVEYSWRENREAAFLPGYASLFGHLMLRYPDSSQPFLTGLLGPAGTAEQTIDLTPPEAETVCRILLDMPDVKAWRKTALLVLPHYRETAQRLLSADQASSDQDRKDRATVWLADLSASHPEFGDPSQADTAKPDSNGPVYHVGGPVTPPQLIHQVDPYYTKKASQARLNGKVLLHIIIGTDGTVEDATVVRSLGLGLDEEAIKAVRQWAFKPGVRNGVPVRVQANVEVNFRLLEKPAGE